MDDMLIVVADGARARLYSMQTGGVKLIEREDLVHPESRLHDRDLGRDRPGRTFDSVGGARHSKEPASSPKEQAAIAFSKEIAGRLERYRTGAGMNAICLVAPPHFLGLLREALSEGCAKVVTQTLAKDLTLASTEAIRQHLLDDR